jgi:tRNA(Arg) A34 adenosine deaminase TadA
MSSTSSPPWIGILRSSRTVRAAETEAGKIAKLKFPSESARWIADELWHPRQRLERRADGSVILHGEMDALERAGRQSASFYRNCTLYTTLSPCPMCSGAIMLYGIPRVVIGENRSFMGEERWLAERGVELRVVQDDRCIALMRDFMRDHPHLWAEDIGV